MVPIPMTVVPGTDAGKFNLICDRCGRAVTDVVGALRDDDVVWTLLTEQGWTGSAFATGPHRCPRCVDTPLPDPVTAVGHDPVAPPPRPCRLETAGLDTAVVSMTGDIDLRDAEPVRDALAHAVALHSAVILDLAAVDTIDSTGLGLLVRAHQDAKQRGGQLCLAAPSRFVLTVLHTMRLDRVFALYGNRDEALTDLARARQPSPDLETREQDVINPWPRPDDSTAPDHRSDEPTPMASIDERLAEQVVEQLRADGRTSSQHITVTVQNRVAILSGWVDSTDAAHIASDQAWRTPGIIDVCNSLDQPDDGHADQ
jgi:anti-sigma B factor antagonist